MNEVKYLTGCIFNPKRPCPLFDLDIKIDGSLCQACMSELSRKVTATAARLTKASIISTLMMAYREKARDLYDDLMKAVDEW